MLKPQIRERLRRSIEILAIITGITGLTLDQFIKNPIILYSTVIVLVILCVVGFITARPNNHFTSKAKVDHVWQSLLANATRCVLIFAGDVSWADRDEEKIRTRTTEGATVQILCRRPGTHEKHISNILKLIEAGSQVRHYDNSHKPRIRGLVVDVSSESPEAGTALTVKKEPKSNILPEPGTPGNETIYNYTATRYIPPADSKIIHVFEQLFATIWEQSLTSMILKPLQLNSSDLASLLSERIVQYKSLSPDDVQLEAVDINSLWSCCNYVKDYKFNEILAILAAHEDQGVAEFSVTYTIRFPHNRLMLPPILEKHGDKYVIIDGMHRLFCLSVIKKKFNANCLVIQPNADLPSKPVQFRTVKVLPEKRKREESFINFNPALFRHIENLDRLLEERSEKFDYRTQ